MSDFSRFARGVDGWEPLAELSHAVLVPVDSSQVI